MGTSYAGEQARAPAEPIAEAGRVYRWWFDTSNDRAIRESEQLFPGGVRFWNRAALTSSGGWNVDLLRWRSGTDLANVSAGEALRNRLQWERNFPHLLLRQAQAAGEALESRGPSQLRFTDAAGATIEVTLDAVSRLPLRAAQIVEGTPPTELLYLDYQRRHGVMMPGRVQLRAGERIIEDLRLGRTEILQPEGSRFVPPAGYSPAPAAGEPAAREIAPGIFYFENMPGDYHSMAIDMGDHVVLVEAPLSPAFAATQRRLIQQRLPGKPVRYVLVTHHHGDHNGGLPTWLETGATIIVPAGARVAIERQLRTRGFTGEVRIEETSGRRSFGSGSRRAEAYIFESSHAETHLIVHVPEHRILFQGDLFYIPARGPVPGAFPIVAELSRQVEELGIKVERIVGVHGRIGSIDEMRQSLRLASE